MADNLEIIRTYAKTFSDHELSQAWRILYEESQIRGESNADRLRYSLKVGDHVEWTGRGNVVRSGEVIKVKRKKCIIAEHLNGKRDKTGARWDIPMSMLREVPKA